MMGSFEDFAELRGLIDALCDETITAEQMRRLEELILRHPAAEACYVQSMSLYADLARHFGGPPDRMAASLRGHLAGEKAEMPPAAPGPKPAPRTARARRRMRAVLGGALAVIGLAAAVLVALALLRPQPKVSIPSVEQGAERLDDSVAVLLQAPGAVWDETQLPTRPGAALSPGRMSLQSGYAQIEFYSGATVILEGPADFHILSRSEGYCTRGKLWATVPPQAQGFTIGSPKKDLVDRGTEFGLQVDQGGRTEVHVFKGKVDLYDHGSDRTAAPHRELTTGRGVRLEDPGRERPIDSDPAAFLTAQDLASRAEAETLRRQQDWLAASEALRRDPSLVVYYPFQNDHPWGRTLRDRSGHSQDGVIVGCSWVTGRWPGKQGLEFRRVSDRVRFHVPGAYDALTLLAWVRVDALPNRFNSLLMTDGGDDAAPHWHISSAGVLELGVQSPSQRGWVHYYSPAVFTPDRLGQWVQVAVVHDRAGGAVAHFVNGRQIAREKLKLDVPLRLGDVELGNWNVATSRNNSPVRYFTGCVDEFVLFARAVPGEEIRRLYEQGRPPP